MKEITLAPRLQANDDAGEIINTLYFGGGTPSILSFDELQSIFAALRSRFVLQEGIEITLEANPESVSEQSLAGYREAGVNRLSFGVQSFDDTELSRLGRLHSAQRARAAVGEARAAGFDNLSLDLMLWLPGQRLDEWLASVDALIDLGPEHASLYLLEIYPNAPLRDTMARGGCLLESNLGSLDARIETQLLALARALDSR